MKTVSPQSFILFIVLIFTSAATFAQQPGKAKPKGQYIHKSPTEGYKWYERNGMSTEVIPAPSSYTLINFKPFRRFTIHNKGMIAISGPKLKGKWKREGDTLVLKIRVREQEASKKEWKTYYRLLPLTNQGFEVVDQKIFFTRQKPRIRPSKN